MTSSNGNIFCVTSHLFKEFTGPRWIPHTKASDAEFDVFFDLRLNKRLSKQSWGWWFDTPSHPLWRHCNDTCSTSQEICTWFVICYLNHHYVLDDYTYITYIIGLPQFQWTTWITGKFLYEFTLKGIPNLSKGSKYMSMGGGGGNWIISWQKNMVIILSLVLLHFQKKTKKTVDHRSPIVPVVFIKWMTNKGAARD